MAKYDLIANDKHIIGDSWSKTLTTSKWWKGLGRSYDLLSGSPGLGWLIVPAANVSMRMGGPTQTHSMCEV